MQSVANYFQEENLLLHIKTAAYFILLYEHFEDMVIDTVREFIGCPCVLDGKLFSNIDDAYIKLLKEKSAQGEEMPVPFEIYLADAQHARENYQKEVLDKVKKGNGRIFRGSLNWLQEHDVITEAENDRILAIRDRRNELVHKLFQEIGRGFSDEDAKMIAEILNFQQCINAWRFQKLDMSIMEIELPDGADPNAAMGGDDVILNGIFRILFCNEGDQFKEALDKELKK